MTFAGLHVSHREKRGVDNMLHGIAAVRCQSATQLLWSLAVSGYTAPFVHPAFRCQAAPHSLYSPDIIPGCKLLLWMVP